MSTKGTFRKTEVLAAIKKRAAAAVDLAATELQSAMKLQLSTAGTGRKHATLRYQSSAPGNPPAVQTGHLRRSVQVDRSQVASNLRATVGTNVPYGRYLEFGTRKMAARPWARPAIAVWKKTILPKLKGILRG
jgi:HK97 gp10 family phage protein